MSRDIPQDGAQVLDLVCARFEDALAEGEVPQNLREHATSCARCTSLEADLVRLASRIREATGPVPVDPAFAAEVYQRMEDMVGGPLERTGDRKRRVWLHVAMPAAAAVAMLVAYSAMRSPQPSPVEPMAIGQNPATLPAADTGAETTPGPAVSEASAPAERVEMVPLQTAESPERAPSAPAGIQVLPEQKVDVGRELREALLRQARSLEGCPRHSARPVTLTVTVGTDGKLSNRQILSSAEAKDAHGCVASALDTLLLPPLKEATTLTVELSW